MSNAARLASGLNEERGRDMALSFDREDLMMTDDIVFSSVFERAEGMSRRVDMGERLSVGG
jgi:hypothetical protein